MCADTNTWQQQRRPCTPTLVSSPRAACRSRRRRTTTSLRTPSPWTGCWARCRPRPPPASPPTLSSTCSDCRRRCSAPTAPPRPSSCTPPCAVWRRRRRPPPPWCRGRASVRRPWTARRPPPVRARRGPPPPARPLCRRRRLSNLWVLWRGQANFSQWDSIIIIWCWRAARFDWKKETLFAAGTRVQCAGDARCLSDALVNFFSVDAKYYWILYRIIWKRCPWRPRLKMDIYIIWCAQVRGWSCWWLYVNCVIKRD